MIAVIGAMRQEIAGIKRMMRADRLRPQPGVGAHGWGAFCGAYAGQEILLLQSGMGAERAQRAAEFARERCASHPGSLLGLLCLGFSGALAQGAEVGDLFLCKKLLSSNVAYVAQACESDEDLLSLAQEVMQESPVKLSTGTSLTVERPVTKPEEKAALNARCQAQVVDMESYWVACFAAEHGMPFLAVRAISDMANESLPPFERFINANGDWLWQEALRHFVSRPGSMATIPRLYRNSLRAGQSLVLFFRAFIPQIGRHTFLAR